MRHLNQEELIDLAEGARAERSAPHLASCDSCRRQLKDLRGLISAAAAVDVPEPSPLFWDHLSARVREAIANDQPGSSSTWAARWMSWRIVAPVGALAAIALAVVMTLGPDLEPLGTMEHLAPPVAEAILGSGEAVALGDDPSLSLIADMAGDLDLEAAAEAGLTSGGTVDRAVMALTPEERLELGRILKEELSKS